MREVGKEEYTTHLRKESPSTIRHVAGIASGYASQFKDFTTEDREKR
jgi:hypothetical protein